MVFTSQAFAGFDEKLPHMQFVGPVKGRPNLAPFDWERLSKATTPKVFVSLGTLLVDIRAAFFQKLIDAFAMSQLPLLRQQIQIFSRNGQKILLSMASFHSPN